MNLYRLFGSRYFAALSAVGFAIIGALAPGAAQAHPHVWVTVKSELVYGPDGAVTGVRHAWTFDDMFSTFATQDITPKQKGVFTREDLAPLAEINVTSLKEYAFFTYAKANGRKTPLADPVDYWLDYDGTALTLHFTLPFKRPAKARTLDMEVYDPTFFVEFSLAEKSPISLSGAPPGCALTVQTPNAADVDAKTKQLTESFFEDPSASADYAAAFSNKISVKCP